MMASNPYFVRKSDVDEEGLVVAVESCLKIMNDPRDHYGTQMDIRTTTGDFYTYPAPDNPLDRDGLTPGYYYTGDRVGLAASTPPPALDRGPSAPYEVAQTNETVRQAIERTPIIDPRPRRDLGNDSVNDTSAKTLSIYTQALPYAATHEHLQGVYSLTSCATALPNAAMKEPVVNFGPYNHGHQGLDRSTPTAYSVLVPAPPPSTPVGPAQTHFQPPTAIMFPPQTILTLPPGPLVGQPVPQALHAVIKIIRRLPTIANTGHPERKVLKKPYEGTYESAAPEHRLIRDHFASGSGLLKKDSLLLQWYGDERVFEARVWEFLAVQRARFPVRV